VAVFRAPLHSPFPRVCSPNSEAIAEWFGSLAELVMSPEPNNTRDILAQRYLARYSFGYPVCPDIQDQYVVELLCCPIALTVRMKANNYILNNQRP